MHSSCQLLSIMFKAAEIINCPCKSGGKALECSFQDVVGPIPTQVNQSFIYAMLPGNTTKLCGQNNCGNCKTEIRQQALWQ